MLKPNKANSEGWGGDKDSAVECRVSRGSVDQMVWRLGQGSSGNQVVIRVSWRVAKVRYTRWRRLQLTVRSVRHKHAQERNANPADAATTDYSQLCSYLR